MKDRMKSKRKELGLSLQKVADLAGTGKSYIWELENSNIKKPSAEKLLEIAIALKTTTEFLLTGMEIKENETMLLRSYHRMDDEDKGKLQRIASLFANEV